jgi:hypothetical protein
MKNITQVGILALVFSISLFKVQAQADRWQQKVNYEMEIDFDTDKHQFKGEQTLTYYNNSPDTLTKVFYHLYFNAFQPGSAMDLRSRWLPDPDPRVGARISRLTPAEIGYLNVEKLRQDGKKVEFQTEGTILEVQLEKPLLPKEKTVLKMEFEGQVPIQIRRSGRNSREGVDYSMAQWYPKLCEYDYQGWHANPYIAREFYGVWGDFDVKIKINKNYVIGGTGYLQNPEEIGHGYLPNGQTAKEARRDKLTWHFKAPNVHDFMWGADGGYKHSSLNRADGLTLHFFYLENDKTAEWAKLPAIMDEAFNFINKKFGPYPYKQYSFVQGGDGGMEYPMATFITGERNLRSLVGVAVHELMHSWYQMILGSNESLYSWMDEGFTDYATNVVFNHLCEKGLIGNIKPQPNPFAQTYGGYFNLASSGKEEPMSTHADHYNTNQAYGLAAYSKGAVFLNQLESVMGKPAFDKALLRYFNTWKFKHPNPNDVIRIMEKECGLELDWYKEYWVNTTRTIDYAVNGIETADKGTKITLERVGGMPMPIDVLITYKSGKKEIVNIPLDIMRGSKPREDQSVPYKVAADWTWVSTTYELFLLGNAVDIESVEIDPSKRVADVNRENNVRKL